MNSNNEIDCNPQRNSEKGGKVPFYEACVHKPVVSKICESLSIQDMANLRLLSNNEQFNRFVTGSILRRAVSRLPVEIYKEIHLRWDAKFKEKDPLKWKVAEEVAFLLRNGWKSEQGSDVVKNDADDTTCLSANARELFGKWEERSQSLIKYVKSGHETSLKMELENRAWVNATNESGETALHCASVRHALVGHQGMVRLLIDAGANLEVRTINGWTVLSYAILNMESEVPKVLIDAGADVNAVGSGGMRPIHIAAYVGNPEIVKQLIDAGADVNALDEKGKTPFDYSVRYEKSAVQDMLLENGVNKMKAFKASPFAMIKKFFW